MTKLYNVKLTAEQMEQLGFKIGPFERAADGEEYYIVDCDGFVGYYKERNDRADDKQYASANYCTDVDIMQQRALHETLNRLLWRFSMQNGGDELDWGSGKSKWRICPGPYCDWTADYNYSQGVGTVYFASEELAEQALEEIVKPFIAEHPEFEVGGCCL